MITPFSKTIGDPISNSFGHPPETLVNAYIRQRLGGVSRSCGLCRSSSRPAAPLPEWPTPRSPEVPTGGRQLGRSSSCCRHVFFGGGVGEGSKSVFSKGCVFFAWNCSLYLPVDTQHTLYPRRFFILQRYELCGHNTTSQRYYIAMQYGE